MGCHRRLSDQSAKSALAGPLEFASIARSARVLAERLDHLGQVFRARTVARSAFLDIALVQPPQIVVQPLVGRG